MHHSPSQPVADQRQRSSPPRLASRKPDSVSTTPTNRKNLPHPYPPPSPRPASKNRSDRNEQHDTAYSLVTALTWQTVLALALPHMGPYARAVAPPSPTLGSLSLCLAAAPAGTPESKRGTKLAVQAAERVEAERVERGVALVRARRSLLEKEYCSLPLQEKVLLLEVGGGVGGGVMREGSVRDFWWGRR